MLDALATLFIPVLLSDSHSARLLACLAAALAIRAALPAAPPLAARGPRPAHNPSERYLTCHRLAVVIRPAGA